MTEIERSNPTTRVFVHALGMLGWACSSVEIDLVKGTARVELKRADGRMLTLDSRHGRTTLTREQQESHVAVVGRRGDRCPVDRLSVRLLGRDRCLGLRHGLKTMAHYVADNSSAGRLETRETFALLLTTAEAASTSPAPASSAGASPAPERGQQRGR